MSNTLGDKQKLLTLLEKIGYDGTVQEFSSACQKFGDIPECLQALEKGFKKLADEAEKEDNRGGTTQRQELHTGKSTILTALKRSLDDAFLNNFNKESLKVDNAPDNTLSPPPAMLQEISDALKALTTRVDNLEAKHRLESSFGAKSGAPRL